MIGTVIGNVTETENAITIGLHDPVAKTTATTIAKGEIGRRRGSGSPDADLIEVRMMSSPTATTSGLRARVAAVRKKKMTTLVETREIQR